MGIFRKPKSPPALPPLEEIPEPPPTVTKEQVEQTRERQSLIRRRAGHRGTILTTSPLAPASTRQATLLGG